MMTKAFLRVALALASLSLMTYAQDALTNDAVVKLIKAGLSEDLVVNMINTQPGNYQVGAQQVLALKKDGVSDKVISAMLSHGSKPAGAVAATPVAAPVTAPAASVVSEVGVYYRKNGVWTELAPEVVNFKTGGVLKSIGTAGVVKGDINGHINGEHSRTQITSPVELLVYAPEGVAITEYQLLRLRETKDGREFRTVTGGVLHVSGGATRDLVPFESNKIAVRTYEIKLPNIGSGEFGLLPPAGSDPNASSGRIGKVYSFRLLE